MKIKWNENEKTRTVYNIIFAIVAISFFFLLYNFEEIRDKIGWIFGVFYPLIIGGVFAFLLNMPLSYMEKKFEKFSFFSKLKPRTRRMIVTTLTYLIFLLFIVLFFSMLIPQLYESIRTLINSASDFLKSNDISKMQELLDKFKIDPQIVNFVTDKAKNFTNSIVSIMANFLPFLKNFAAGFVSTTISWFIGFVASIYIVFDKENFGALARKITYSILPMKYANNISRVVSKINTTMKGYIGGQILVVSILGVIVALALAVLGVEGAIAMGFIIAVTDLIPYIGPWIGSAPVFLMISVQDFNKALIFIVIILIAQQIEENLLKPRVQSDKLGISAFWILVAVIVGGSLFGIVGMIVGVPIFVVIYQLIKEVAEHSLRKKGLPVETKDYMKDISIKGDNKSGSDKILDMEMDKK